MPSAAEPVVIRQNVIRPDSTQPLHVAVQLDRPQRVAIHIYTRNGKLVKTLVDQVQNAGTFDAVWQGVNQNGQVVGSGVYIVLIQTETFEEKRK
jgi:flagellar hook assembly protein FlgD